MSFARVRVFVGAPAVVVLATVVNAAAASDRVFAPADTATPDLSWALKGGSHAARNTRVYLAKHAANTIHSLDRLAAAAPYVAVVALAAAPSFEPRSVPPFQAPAQQPARSTHQHSAP
jgi:hypothetical protein